MLQEQKFGTDIEVFEMCQGCIHTGTGTKGRTQPIVCRVKQQQTHILILTLS